MAQDKPSAIGSSATPHLGSSIPTVRPSAPIFASHTNAIVQSVNRLSEQHNRAGNPSLGTTDDGVIAIVANRSGVVLDRGHTVRLGNQEKARPSALRQIIISGYAFADGDDMTRFGICAERIDPLMSGRVFTSGVCHVRVTEPAQTYTVTDEDDNPLDGATVDVYADSSQSYLVTTKTTDSDGEVALNLTSGTYYIWRSLGAYPFADPDILEIDAGARTNGTAQVGRRDLALSDSGLAEVIWEDNGWAVVRFPVGAAATTGGANWQVVWNEGQDAITPS